MSLSINIKRFRKAKGISQECMAECLHMHQSVYSRLENNDQACAERLSPIADALGTTPDMLRANYLTDKGDPVSVPAKDGTASEIMLLSKDEIIQYQAEEITFLRQQVAHLQVVWHQDCRG